MSGPKSMVDRGMISRAVADAQVPTLMLALVHMTGDARRIVPENWPRYRVGEPQGQLPEMLQDEVRAEAVEAIAAHFEAGSPPLPAPAPDILRAMMNFAAGAEIPERYLPFLSEQLAIDSIDPQRPDWKLADVAPDRRLTVAIIGAGLSGLLAAYRCQQAGIPWTLYEKNPDVGGSWFENTYPGCRVDSSNFTYSYSFDSQFEWPQHFSTQEVILSYLRDFADRHGLRENIRFGAEVREAVFDEQANIWRLDLEEAGKRRTVETSALIAAVGQLNRPRLPDIPGIDDFRGPAFHTAEWRHDVELKGKRVAVIGTGASAFQVVPTIAADVAEMHVFQRSAPWLLPTPDYHHDVEAGMHWLFRNMPFYEKWYRFHLFWEITDGSYDFMRVDPAWNEPGSVGPLNAKIRQRITAWIQAQVPDDEALLAKLIPDYHFGGKRACRDNGVWISALRRDNVHLITDRIERITPTGLRLADGREIEADVIVYGTGFKASQFLFPMRIVGREGRSIEEAWDGDARAFLGVAVPGFPNFFILYGPNTNIVANGSVIFMSECGTRFVTGCLELLARSGAPTIEIRSEVYDRFSEDVDRASRLMSWGAPGVTSWYKNERGRATSAWPLPLVDYWERTRRPDPADFIVGGDGATGNGDVAMKVAVG